MFLARGNVQPDAKDNYGQTPLSRAAENGHEAVAKLILATDRVKLDVKHNDGRTPLSLAAMNGTIIKLLLHTGKVDANCF
jgi:ankyrin repeat protein